MKTLKIDPAVSVLVGTELGRQERERLGLDRIDDTDEQAVVQIETPAVLSDFIRGLVGPSVHRLGFEGFAAKYHIDAAPGVRESILQTARLEEPSKGTGRG